MLPRSLICTALVLHCLCSLVLRGASSFYPSHSSVPSNQEATFTFNLSDKYEGIDRNGHLYGVDVTFPVFTAALKNKYFRKRYERMMEGCFRAYSRAECQAHEAARMEMNRLQPPLQHNYTTEGYFVTTAPKELYEDILAYYKATESQGATERWPRANTFTNHWNAPSYVLASSFNRNIRDGGIASGLTLMQRVFDELRPLVQKWINRPVADAGYYGIRIYRQGAVMATHVDKEPFVISAVVQVTQDVDDNWQFEVYTRQGKAKNISLTVGQLLLYEGQTLLHGRPFPLQGRLVANLYAHFYPLSHYEENLADDVARDRTVNRKAEKILVDKDKVRTFARDEMLKRRAGHEHENLVSELADRHLHQQFMHDLTHKSIAELGSNLLHVLSNNTKQFDQNDSNQPELHEPMQRPPRGRTDLHSAAARGKLDVCKALLREHRDLVNARDENGWQAVHESARAGYIDVLELLLHYGADMNAKTLTGQTPLWWAKQSLYEGHPVIVFLEEHGADDGDE